VSNDAASLATILARIVAESDAGLARWARWSPEVFAGLPPWARSISNASVTVRVVVSVPDDIEPPAGTIAVHHGDDGSTERMLVVEHTLTTVRDHGGWVARGTLGADPQTAAGRHIIAALRGLESLGHVERDTRHWWRPTAAGREAAR
jgi:hypothetical protein